jgi:hypothetical protein
MDRSVVGALGDTFQYMKSGLGRLVTSKILGKRGRACRQILSRSSTGGSGKPGNVRYILKYLWSLWRKFWGDISEGEAITEFELVNVGFVVGHSF